MSMSAYVLVFMIKASYGIILPHSIEFDTYDACQAERIRLTTTLNDKLVYINCAPKSLQK